MTPNLIPGTELHISPIAFGCMSIVESQTYPALARDQAIGAIRAALDHGVTLFDTARAYADGQSEQLLGEALEGDRDRVVLATKPSKNDPKQLTEQCHDSLRWLRTDYIDLYQIHWPNRDVPFEDTARALEDLRDAGKIRAIGVCNFGPKDLAEFTALTKCATNQIAYSMLTRAVEFEVADQCVDAGIGLLCYSPLAQGILAGRFQSADDVPSGRARTRHFAGTRPEARHGGAGCEAETFAAVAAIQEVADRVGVSMAELSLAWLIRQPGVASVLVGASRPDQVERNMAALKVDLNDRDLADLDTATATVKEKMGPDLDLWASPSRVR